MLRTDLSSIESLRSSVQILLYWFLESVLDRSGTFSPPAESTTETKKHISLTPRNGRQSIGVGVWRDRVPGHLLPGRRRYAATDTLRRPRGAIPRLAPPRLLSGLTSFWPDCRRDFNSAFARRFEFRFAIQKQYSRSLPSRQRLWRWCHRLVWTAFRYPP